MDGRDGRDGMDGRDGRVGRDGRDGNEGMEETSMDEGNLSFSRNSFTSVAPMRSAAAVAASRARLAALSRSSWDTRRSVEPLMASPRSLEPKWGWGAARSVVHAGSKFWATESSIALVTN